LGCRIKDQQIAIREEKDGSVSILNVTEEEARSAEQMLTLLERGGCHRTTASTLMNDASSRSHAIFTIFIEQHKIDDLYQKDAKQKTVGVSMDTEFMNAKFFFVDLAGSERVKKTGASGVTLKEGININLGLLELGNVISALSTI
jgi:kinesin family protein 4/21/27